MRPLSRFVELLTSDEMEMLHDRALQLLADPGMRIANQQILLALQRSGVRVDLQTETARFPRQLVEATIDTARREEAARLANGHTEVDAPNALTFSWHTAYASRTPEVQVSLGGGCPRYYDYGEQRSRDATASDFMRMVHLAEGIPEIVTVGNAVHYLKEADGTDVPPLMVAIKGAAVVAEHSRKPGCTAIMDHRQLDYLVEMGTIVRGSAQEYLRRPIFVNINDTDPPLQLSRPEAAIMLELARRGISVFILPMPLAGIAGPISPIANAIIGTAEILGVWTAAKAVNGETPVEAAVVSGVLDPRTGTARFATPQAVLQDGAVAQLFRSRYGLRCGTGVGLIDAAVPGLQAIFERMLKALGSSLSGEPAFPVGILAAGLVFSPEQMILDLEIARAQHALCRGIGGNQFAESLELIREKGIGGLFIDTEHTARHLREELWLPQAFGAGASGDGSTAPASDPVKLAHAKWKETLDKTEPYTIDDVRRRAIETVVERARVKLAGTS